MVGKKGELFSLVEEEPNHGGVAQEVFNYADGSFVQFYGNLFDVVVVTLGGHQVGGYLAT